MLSSSTLSSTTTSEVTTLRLITTSGNSYNIPLILGVLCGLLVVCLITLIMFLLLHLVRKRKVSVFFLRLAKRQEESLANNPASEEITVVDDEALHTNRNTSGPLPVTPQVDEGCGHQQHSISAPSSKFDNNPVYIFLGPKDTYPALREPPTKLKENSAYVHSDTEGSPAAVSPGTAEHKIIQCKQNLAYKHLGPAGAPLDLS